MEEMKIDYRRLLFFIPLGSLAILLEVVVGAFGSLRPVGEHGHDHVDPGSD